MNCKLILQLSIFGLAMGIATVFVIPSNIEPMFWVAIFVISASLISKHCKRLFFLNGFMVSIVNSVWVTSAHVLLFDAYSARHASEMEMMARLPFGESPRLLMILMAPVFGIVSGVVLGLFSYVAHRIRNASRAKAQVH